MGKYSLRTNIVLDKTSVEQVSCFSFLGCDITYDVDHMVAKFQSVCGTICQILSRKTKKEIQLKFYKIMAVPVVLFGSETWSPKKRLIC